VTLTFDSDPKLDGFTGLMLEHLLWMGLYVLSTCYRLVHKLAYYRQSDDDEGVSVAP